jgi:hypothetical protein
MAADTGKLTALAIKSAKPGKHFDVGLHLDLRANGSRYWRMKYRHGGKERVLAFGGVTRGIASGGTAHFPMHLADALATGGTRS